MFRSLIAAVAGVTFAITPARAQPADGDMDRMVEQTRVTAFVLTVVQQCGALNQGVAEGVDAAFEKEADALGNEAYTILNQAYGRSVTEALIALNKDRTAVCQRVTLNDLARLYGVASGALTFFHPQ